MNNKPYILGIGGSPRKNGNTDILMEEIMKGARGAHSEIIQLRDHEKNQCTGCENCRVGNCSIYDDGLKETIAKMSEADGLVIGTPVYMYNVTGLTKIFLDRLYPLYKFSPDRRSWESRLPSGKKALIFAVGEQEEGISCPALSLDALRMPLKDLGYEIVDELVAAGFYDKAEVKRDSSVMINFRRAGEKLSQK